MTSTTSPVSVVVPGGSRVVHAGRKAGTYASGATRWHKLCASGGADRYRPSPTAVPVPITCKRCLAKLAGAGS